VRQDEVHRLLDFLLRWRGREIQRGNLQQLYS
jgi:hypothetical protein